MTETAGRERLFFVDSLMHAVIIAALASVIAFLGRHLPGDLGYWAAALLVLAVATPIAWLLYATVEKPGIRLGDRVFRRSLAYLNRRAPTAPVSV